MRTATASSAAPQLRRFRVMFVQPAYRLGYVDVAAYSHDGAEADANELLDADSDEIEWEFPEVMETGSVEDIGESEDMSTHRWAPTLRRTSRGDRPRRAKRAFRGGVRDVRRNAFLASPAQL